MVGIDLPEMLVHDLPNRPKCEQAIGTVTYMYIVCVQSTFRPQLGFRHIFWAFLHVSDHSKMKKWQKFFLEF